MSSEEIYRVIHNYFADKPVKKVQVFGSFARKKNVDNSDIDLLVTMQKHVGLIKLAGYKLELEEMLHKNVDLITEPSINNMFKEIIQPDLTTVYESTK
jgi:uncharacterized protein